MILTWFLPTEGHVIMIPSLRIMQRVGLHCIIIEYYYIIIAQYSIITH